jgi:hypothetical protein
LAVANDTEPHQTSDAPVHVEIGIAVVDPAADALGRAVGQLEVYVDNDAALVERDGDGRGFRLGREFGYVLCEDSCALDKDNDENDNASRESHSEIVSGGKDFVFGRP